MIKKLIFSCRCRRFKGLKWFPLLAGVAVLAVSPALAESWQTTCDERCEVPEGKNLVRINAFALEIDALSSLSFPQGTRVSLVIYNKNPFANSYELEVEAVEMELATIRSFLTRVIPGFASLSDREKDHGEAGEEEVAGHAERDAQTCSLTGAQEAWTEIQSLRDKARNSYDSVSTELRAVETKLKSYQEFTARIARPIVGESQCRSVCQQAAAVSQKLQEVVESEAQLKKEIRELQSLVKQIVDLQERMSSQIRAMPAGTAQDDCSGWLNNLEILVNRTVTNSKETEGDVEKLSKQKKALAEARKNIDEVLATEDSFVEARPLPVRDAPTRYDLTLTKKPLGKGQSKTVELGSINVGKNRFSVSAGFGVSFIEEEAFGRQPAPGEDGQPVSSFAVTKRSNEHLAGVFQINARLASWGQSNRAGFFWSLGAGIASGDTSSEVSLYTGPTLGFLDDKLFFTLAFHQRSVETLSGFEVGDPIPMEVMDPLPTTEDNKGGLLFTVTLRFN